MRFGHPGLNSTLNIRNKCAAGSREHYRKQWSVCFYVVQDINKRDRRFNYMTLNVRIVAEELRGSGFRAFFIFME